MFNVPILSQCFLKSGVEKNTTFWPFELLGIQLCCNQLSLDQMPLDQMPWDQWSWDHLFLDQFVLGSIVLGSIVLGSFVFESTGFCINCLGIHLTRVQLSWDQFTCGQISSLFQVRDNPLLLKQSSLRTGEDSVVDRCSHCGAVREEYTEDEVIIWRFDWSIFCLIKTVLTRRVFEDLINRHFALANCLINQDGSEEVNCP